MPITQQPIDDACKHLRNELRKLDPEAHFTFQLVRHPFSVDNGKKARLLAELPLSMAKILQVDLHYTSRGVRFTWVRLINRGGPRFLYTNKETMPRFEKICLKQVKHDLRTCTNLPQKLGDF
jgi:Fic family protein|nr:MAG TPA: hypothetical protein [Caudoviricetes sp.]